MRVLLCRENIQVKHCKGQGQLRDLDRFPRSTWTYYQLQLGAAPGNAAWCDEREAVRRREVFPQWRSK